MRGVLGALGEAVDVGDTVEDVGLGFAAGYGERIARGGVEVGDAGGVEDVLRRGRVAAQAFGADDAAAELIADGVAPVNDGDAMAF